MQSFDPGKRSQLGAHYTDPDKIMLIVNPVVVEPLTREWEDIKPNIEAHFAKAKAAKEARPPARTNVTRFHQGQRQREENARREARKLFDGFIEHLRNFRVLDPACGSGNFLFLALKALKDIEQRANVDFSELSKAYDVPVGVFIPVVGPENVKGIEINPFAAELARVSVWIGEIQWMREHGLDASRDPILKPLKTIECRDALLNKDGTEAEWPEADVIIGNPPFLGGKLFRTYLGDEEVERIFAAYDGRVPAEADLVCYWFEKAWEQITQKFAARAGLVATNSIRGGANREICDDITDEGPIFEAWSDEPWIADGADVRVSIVCFDREKAGTYRLDGAPVSQINADLTSTATNLTKVAQIASNLDIAFMGDSKGGKFDIPGERAREWLRLPKNPNGRSNSDVLRPWINGADISKRPGDKWIVDFGWTMDEAAAALYEKPFGYASAAIKPKRLKNNREAYAKYWWRHVEPRQGMWTKLRPLKRYIATVRHSKYRLFRWFPTTIVPDSALIAIARDDDTAFGILHSKFHEAWSLGLCSWIGIGNDPRYTPSTTFETFPFPAGLTPDIPASNYAKVPSAKAIAKAAATERAAGKLAQSTRAGEASTGSLPDLSRPHITRGRKSRCNPKKADANKSLQRPPIMVRERPSRSRCRSSGRLWLVR